MKRDLRELKRRERLASNGRRSPIVGKSDGLISERTRKNQTKISHRCTVRQKRGTKKAITSVLESPRVRAARRLLLSRYTQQQLPRGLGGVVLAEGNEGRKFHPVDESSMTG